MEKSSLKAGLTPYRKYVLGFLLSLLFTLAAYFLTKHHLDSGHVSPSDRVTVIYLMIFALLQLLTQLVFFLHLAEEEQPRWKLVITLFAAIVVFIVVAGSLWIMWNLNYHMQPAETDQQIIHDEGVQF